jgi:hypothetical protein
MTPWWWLSFADGEKPKGEQFLGGCLVQADDFLGAVAEATRIGINPGGECRGLGPIPEPGPIPVNVLLSKYQIPDAEKWPEMEETH